MDNEITFGIENQDIQELRKALEVGYGTSPETQTGFGATRLESLEKTLKYAVEEEKASKFWKALKKGKGNSTVEEFTTVNNIGSAGFYVEGGLPEEFDEDIRREFETTKYVGTVGKVPNVAQSVKSMANNMATIQKLKAIAIIRTCNLKSFFGDSSKVSVEWNGFYSQFKKRAKYVSQNTIDLKGKVLNEDTLADVSKIIQDNWGDPENIQGWISNGAFKNYAQELIKNKTFMVGNNEVRSIVSVPKTYNVGDGAGSLETDIHLRYKGQTNIDDLFPKMNKTQTAFSATHAKAPATLNSGTASATAGGSGGTVPAGTYDYAVLAGNKYGVSASYVISGVAVTLGQKVTFTLADNSSIVGQEAEFFEIYRRADGEANTDFRFLASFKVGDTIVDDGSEIPGTEYGFFFDWNFDQVLDFKQLLPMVKMPLATIDDSVRWLQKLYGTPILYNPNKMVVVKNIGSTSWS